MNDLVPNVKIEGTVLLDDENIYDPQVDTTLLRKKVGMVFQQPNPFPMSIYDNIAYGPRIHGIKNKAQLDEIVERSLRGAALWDEVSDRLKKSALGLSGGQHQVGRVGIPEFQEKEPEGQVKKPQADHGEAHDRPGLKRHLQAGIQAVRGRAGGAAVGGGGDFHADEAGQAGEKAAGDKGKGDEHGEESARGHGGLQQKHGDKEQEYTPVLAFQICARALAYRHGNPDHFPGTGIAFQNSPRKIRRKQQGDDRADRCQIRKIHR